jgi:hypothetical protein
VVPRAVHLLLVQMTGGTMANPLTDDMERTPPQTEDAAERGFARDDESDENLGESAELDPDGVGDIADEGSGHRG